MYMYRYFEIDEFFTILEMQIYIFILSSIIYTLF